MAAAALALVGIPAPVAADKIKIGGLAPKYELTLIDRTKISSEQLRGQVVVLNFWATWCVPCRAADARHLLSAPEEVRPARVRSRDRRFGAALPVEAAVR